MKAPLAVGERVRLPKRNPTEDSVEDHLVRNVEGRGGVAVKLQLLPGWPDRLILWDHALAHFIETKRPKGGVFQPRQPRTLRMLGNMQFVALVLHTKELVDVYIAACTTVREGHTRRGRNEVASCTRLYDADKTGALLSCRIEELLRTTE